MASGDASSASGLAIAKKLCMNFQSEDRKLRKKTLIDLEELLKDSDSECHHEIFKECHIYMLNTLRDKSEPVREQSIKFLKLYYIDVLPRNDYYLSYLFPVLVERIGNVEIIEESEELRLQLIYFLQAIIEKYKENNVLRPFLNDFVTIFRETVRDRFYTVKEVTCKSIVGLALALPKDFHMQASNLTENVTRAFGHQRFRVRIEAVKCIGEIVLHGDYRVLEEVIGPLAEKVFDHIPAVRLTVAQVAARWLTEYRDRYSFFHKILPLILTGLNDDVAEIREETLQMWTAVGLQYQKENEKDLKDQLDYLTDMPKYYPENMERPNLGCRVLVQRSIGKLTGALARELVSWQSDVKLMCSQLLCSLAHHAEGGLTQHLQDLLMSMYSTARDENKYIVKNIIKASEIMATFVQVDTWKQLMLPIIEDQCHYGHLIVMAAFIRGCPQDYISSSLREFSQTLADPSVLYCRKMKYQKELINCVQAIESNFSQDLSDDIGQYLFNIIVVVVSIKDRDNADISLDLLTSLVDTMQLESETELWRKYLPKLLESINKDPGAWTEVTTERCIFEVVLIHSGEAFGENVEAIGEILIACLNVDVEPECRLKTFGALTTALDNKDVVLKRAENNLEPFLEKLISEVLVPTLVWHAGRTAEAMRTMAASCLCSALSPGIDVNLFSSKEVLRLLVDRLIPLLLSLTEDAAYRSRYLAMEALVLLMDCLLSKDDWQMNDFLKIYPDIVRRLDDPTDKVRYSALQSLGALLANAPKEFRDSNYKAHHNLLLDTLLTHFDDEDDPHFQAKVSDVIKSMVVVSREAVEDKVKRHKPLIRNQKGCEDIIDYLQKLAV